MKFTIVITTYNSEKYIEEAIFSVINQTRKPDEIFICDDNSTDNTISICEKYKDVLQIVINKNGPSGFNNAFNKALKTGNGDYVTILHYDDYLHPDFLYHAEQALEKTSSCKFLYVSSNFVDIKNKEVKKQNPSTNINVIKLSGLEYAKKYLKSIRGANHIHRCPGTLIHKSLINEGMLFREEAGIINDDDFFLRVGKHTDIVGLEFPFATVRLHAASETGKHSNLAFQLAQDWLFQYKEYLNGYTILDDECGKLIYGYAINTLTTALNTSLDTGNKFELKKITEVMKELEQLSNRKIYNEVNFFYRKFLWVLLNKEQFQLAKFINSLILIGRKIKSSL